MELVLQNPCYGLLVSFSLQQKSMMRLLPVLLKPNCNSKVKVHNLLLVLYQVQKALPPLQQDTAAIPIPQVRDLRRYHLGVGVASAHSSAS